MVDQAADAVKAAIGDGKRRHQVTFLLPVNEKEISFMATEPVDYPCSLQKEFDTACALAEALLAKLAPGAEAVGKDVGEAGTEGEPCRLLYTRDKSVGAIIYPTAERLKDIEGAVAMLESLVIVNPQWSDGRGQVISDFGFGPWRKRAEDFLATFERSDSLVETRIGNPGSIDTATGERFVNGGVVRVLRAYPGAYDVHCVIADGTSAFLTTADARPGYKELEAAITAGRAQGMEIFTRGREIWRGSTAGVAVTAGSSPSRGATAEDVDLLDKSTIHRMLLARGLPTSGRLSTLRERLKAALSEPTKAT